MQKVSIIIEWENVLIAEMDRCRAMLRELRQQILELKQGGQTSGGTGPYAFPFELMVIHDRESVPADVIKQELAQVFQPADSFVQTSLAASTGMRYYELKNFGAKRATGELIFFLDSDVIPEPGWLKHLLGAFNNPEVQLVGGNTYVDPADLMGRTFALTWIFPRRSAETALVKVNNFFANNVAFRRETILRHGFPEIPGTDRGSCGRLAMTLREQGIDVYLHQDARVSHPPTNGLRHFIVRGMAQGRDDVFVYRALRGRSKYLAEAWRQIGVCRRVTACGLSSIFRHRKSVNLPLWQTPFAVLITFGYYQCRLAGALLTQVCPQYMQSHFRI